MTPRGERSGGEPEVVPRARPTSYYGRPILKAPVWSPDVPWYLFAGGLAGGSALVAEAAARTGNTVLARRALLTSLTAVSASPVLLVRDLGRPERFHHMLRVVKVTSPMSVGSWVLAGAGAATGVATTCEVLGVLPGTRRVAMGAAAALGAPLATYTAALLADTAVPAWHGARLELPVVFASSALASAAGAAVVLTPTRAAGPARHLGIGAAVVEIAATEFATARLGELGPVSHRGNAGRLARAARWSTAAGAALLAVAGRRRAGAILGGAGLLAGAACLRWAVFLGGVESAKEPASVVGPHRARVEARQSATADGRTAR